jgi:predicted SpoU family rRNA methylase
MRDGATALAKVLRNHPSLMYLRLSNNMIGTRGCIRIAEILRDNRVLKMLFLDHNAIGSSGLIYLAKVLGNQNSVLKVTTLWGNNFHSETKEGSCNDDFKATNAHTEGAVQEKACAVWHDLIENQKKLEFDDVDVAFYCVEGEWNVAVNQGFSDTLLDI